MLYRWAASRILLMHLLFSNGSVTSGEGINLFTKKGKGIKYIFSAMPSMPFSMIHLCLNFLFSNIYVVNAIGMGRHQKLGVTHLILIDCHS